MDPNLATPPHAPQQANEPVAYTASANMDQNSSKDNNFLKRLFQKKAVTIGLAVIALFFTATIAVSAATIYTDLKIPVVSKYKKELMMLSYNIPLIPKSPEQILITAVERNSKLKTYVSDISLLAQMKGINIELGSLDLLINGPADISDPSKPSFNVNAKASVNFGGNSYQIEGKLMQKDKIIYAKIDKLPDDLIKLYTSLYTYNSTTTDNTAHEAEVKQNLEKLFANWIKYDISGLETNARKELEKNTENTSVTTEIKNETQDFLLNSSIIPEVKKLKDETIEGVSTYHLELKPKKDKIKKIILEYAKDNETLSKKEYNQTVESFANSIDELHISVWVGKRDAIVRKSSVQTVINLSQLQNLYNPYNYTPIPQTPSNVLGIDDFANTKLAFSVVAVLKDVNRPVTITAPEKSITATSYMQMFSDALLTQEQRAQKEKEKVYQTDLTEITKALTSYYVENGVYPTNLSSLSGVYIPSTSQVASRLGTYTYRRGASGRTFIIYILNPVNSTYSTQFYGATSNSAYPHQLSSYELTSLL